MFRHVVIALCLVGCSTSGTTRKVPKSGSSANTVAPKQADAKPKVTPSTAIKPKTEKSTSAKNSRDVLTKPPAPPPPPDPKVVAKAKRLVKKGVELYYKGDYDGAEHLLKQAIVAYPFSAKANLALGKIFLIRGSAGRDRALINSARLMFEMAHALDGRLRETRVLLELFMGPSPE
jgi:hypothetical protein